MNTEHDHVAICCLEGMILAPVPACPNADLVMPRLDGYFDRVVPVDRPDAVAVDQDIERASSELPPDPFSR
jgi:hypothetical protein